MPDGRCDSYKSPDTSGICERITLASSWCRVKPRKKTHLKVYGILLFPRPLGWVSLISSMSSPYRLLRHGLQYLVLHFFAASVQLITSVGSR